MNNSIKHENNKFFKIVDELECHLEYMVQDEDTIVFYHTYVPPELRGKGLAMEIIREGLDYAVSNNKKIVPSCSAVQLFVERNKEYQEHVKQS